MSGQVITVKLNRGDGTSWGFRLQGGKDFSAPLAVQRVNPGSLAEKGGLQAGDVLLSVCGQNADNLRHKEAQDVIIRSGNNLELTVERGGMSIWKPSVTPLGNKAYPGADPTPLTKTSLAHNKQESAPIGSGHNSRAQPFGNTVPAVVHNQYNSPANLYSMQNIAEALSAQTEVLATGAVGINFMKPEKQINTGSAVYQLVHQEKEPSGPKGEENVINTQSNAFRRLQCSVDEPPKPLPKPVMRPVEAPVNRPPSDKPAEGNPSICADCGRLIVGVFVRVKDKSLHAECFRCSTCGTNLKNQGYYNVNDKLYCDIHAKQAAKMIGSSNMEPVTVAPGGTIPFNTSILGVGPTPPPFSAGPVSPHMSGPRSPGQPSNISGPRSPGQPSNFSNIGMAPLPFQSVKAPMSPVTSPVQAPVLGSSLYMHPQTAPPADAHRHIQAPTSGLTNNQGSKPAPRRGKGQLKQATPGARIPVCSVCGTPIRGPFIVALGKTWCPDHFQCKNNSCNRPLADVGFVEEQGQLYCECCWESFLAPVCCKCNTRIKGDCLNALNRQWHPDCFVCSNCRKPFGNSSFYLEDGNPYCEKDWNELFTTKCVGCGFPIEAGDRWVEALNNNYHSQCFKCTVCQKNLEGQSFYAKGGRPFCKAHAR